MISYNGDKPIISKENDYFHFTPVVEDVSTVMKSIHKNGVIAENSYVFGIEGEWGSGKSSLINLLKEQLGDDADFREFHPWRYSTLDKGMLGLFDVFIQKYKNSPDKIKIFQGLLSCLSGGASIARLFPGFEIPAAILKQSIDLVQELSPQEESINLDDVRQKAVEILKEEKKPTIIIIDDLDRLTPHEVKQVFQLIKNIADLPNIIYLLAYDRQEIQKILESEWPHIGEKYIEKIVQQSIPVPKANNLSVLNFFWEKFSLLLGADIHDKEELRKSPILRRSIMPLLHTPRQALRLYNAMIYSYPILKKDTNPIELIFMELLRISYPKIHQYIYDKKADFINFGVFDPNDINAVFSDQKETKKIQEIINKELSSLLPNYFKEEKITDIFSLIFPKMNPFDSSDKSKDVATIQNKRYFNHYFRLHLPKNIMNVEEIEYGLEQLKLSADAFYKFLTEANTSAYYSYSSRARDFFDIFHSAYYLPEKLTDQQKKNLAECCFKYADFFEERDIGAPKDFLVRYAEEAWQKNIITINDIKGWIENQHSLFSALYIVLRAGVSKNFWKCKDIKWQQGWQDTELNKVDLNELKEKLTLKIEHAVKDGSIIQYLRFAQFASFLSLQSIEKGEIKKLFTHLYENYFEEMILNIKESGICHFSHEEKEVHYIKHDDWSDYIDIEAWVEKAKKIRNEDNTEDVDIFLQAVENGKNPKYKRLYSL